MNVLSCAFCHSSPQSLPACSRVATQAFGLWNDLHAKRWAFLETDNGANPNFDALPPATMRMLERPFGELLDTLEAEFGNTLAPLYQLFNGLMIIGPGPLRDVSAMSTWIVFFPAA